MENTRTVEKALKGRNDDFFTIGKKIWIDRQHSALEVIVAVDGPKKTYDGWYALVTLRPATAEEFAAGLERVGKREQAAKLRIAAANLMD